MLDINKISSNSFHYETKQTKTNFTKDFNPNTHQRVKSFKRVEKSTLLQDICMNSDMHFQQKDNDKPTRHSKMQKDQLLIQQSEKK
jgi:hypothetical protein